MKMLERPALAYGHLKVELGAATQHEREFGCLGRPVGLGPLDNAMLKFGLGPDENGALRRLMAICRRLMATSENEDCVA